MCPRFAALVLLLGALPLQAGEQEALAISANIRAIHMPYGTIVDPVFTTPDSNQIVSYTRCGDSAIWTGHYLAAEAFHYNVTGSPAALDNVRSALAGIRSLIDVTGSNLLARCLVPVDSPYAAAINSEEAGHGIFTGTVAGRAYYWIGNTSRDQYSGVFFGLGTAYGLVEEADVRAGVREIVTRLLDFLQDHNWAVVMPDGSLSTVFWGRADQVLSFLQIGRQVNPDRFGRDYSISRFWYAAWVGSAIAFEVLDPHGSYFKFNLDMINLHNLLRYERSDYYRWFYAGAYRILRRTVEDHGNAFFNLIDRALLGPDARRDEETRDLLEAWLQRPRRDNWVDLRGVYPSCQSADRACSPIPVPQRVRTDFLWQRSPFLLYGGGEGRIEGAGIDYILPYWMARHYGVL